MIKGIDNQRKLKILFVLLGVLVLSYLGLIIYNFKSLKKYDSMVFPNTYVEEVDLSNYTFENAVKILKFYEDYLLSKKVTLNINSAKYEYSLKELGAKLDVEGIINNINKYQSNLGYSKRMYYSTGRHRNNFDIIFTVDKGLLTVFLTDIKNTVDVVKVDGYFDTSEGVKYIKGTNGFILNKEDSVSLIVDTLSKRVDYTKDIVLVGDYMEPNYNASYESIDTMTSSFVTNFVPDTYLRNVNLITALGYINGTVVEPGEIFSYCDKAGPFNKAGYVFYYEFVGNGVCQIATTTYDAALLGGLEIIKRYPHKKKSLYVDGGLDATVASYSSGWCVDMQFRNTYKYPIYIKAYPVGSTAHVEFWSNHDAKEGKEYSLESVRIGQRGYKSYLHTFKDGVEIDRSEITTTWYSED